MNYRNKSMLLRNKRVISEIERYRWIESEKCGYDIGFERAADHWIVFYALAWLKYHSCLRRKQRAKPLSRYFLRSKRSR